jgi:hypothetical protein
MTGSWENALVQIEKGKIAVIKGFKSKVGKTFNAVLKLDENCRAGFDFSWEKPGKGKKQ